MRICAGPVGQQSGNVEKVLVFKSKICSLDANWLALAGVGPGLWGGVGEGQALP